MLGNWGWPHRLPAQSGGRTCGTVGGLVGGVHGVHRRMGTTRQQVLLETLAARQRAGELLKTLEQAQVECEGCLKNEQRQDLVKSLTGKSSIEQAIGQTKRMMEMLDRALADAGNGGNGDGTEDSRLEVVARIGMGGVVEGRGGV